MPELQINVRGLGEGRCFFRESLSNELREDEKNLYIYCICAICIFLTRFLTANKITFVLLFTLKIEILRYAMGFLFDGKSDGE